MPVNLNHNYICSKCLYYNYDHIVHKTSIICYQIKMFDTDNENPKTVLILPQILEEHNKPCHRK